MPVETVPSIRKMSQCDTSILSFRPALHVVCLMSDVGLQNKKARLVLVGLDDAGKTSLMYMLKEARITQTFPTGQPSTFFHFLLVPSSAISQACSVLAVFSLIGLNSSLYSHQSAR